MKTKSVGIKIFLGIALAIILFSLFNLGISTFYPEPAYNSSCYNYYDKPCLANETCTIDQAKIDACNLSNETARKTYENTIFYFFVIIGLILAIVGLFITSLAFQITSLGAGLSLIIEGIIRNLNNKIPAFIAGVAVFIILSYFIWRKFK